MVYMRPNSFGTWQARLAERLAYLPPTPSLQGVQHSTLALQHPERPLLLPLPAVERMNCLFLRVTLLGVPAVCLILLSR